MSSPELAAVAGTRESLVLRTAIWLTLASSAAVVVGIAPSQILLGMALAALLFCREQFRLPPVALPLALFLLGTLIALAFSEDPAAGLPQVRKMYVFCQLLVVFSLLRKVVHIRYLVIAWAGLAAISAGVGVVQFAQKVKQAQTSGADFYTFYVGERITGFMSHWYTFSVLGMLALLMAVSYLFFATDTRRRTRVELLICTAAIAVGIVLAETRAVWIATAAGCLYLVWFWRRRLVILVPILLLAGFFAAPEALRTRALSIVRPGALDSNQFRVVTSRTGLRMIRQHPLLGLGPEVPRLKFNDYVPEDIPRPLPDGSYIHLHNIYLHYAAERGIPVLLCFLWLMGKILYDFRQGLLKLTPARDDRRFVLHGGIAVVIALLVEGFADVNLGDSEVLAMFLAIVGCGYAAIGSWNVDRRSWAGARES
jgi:putative inorganic carbon (HCO3(-)) transporter